MTTELNDTTTCQERRSAICRDLARTRIRTLNDKLRTDPCGMNAQVVITKGVNDCGVTFVARAFNAVHDFSDLDFDTENDPYCEHDFGSFTIDGKTLFWKIDYYDLDEEYGSPDPSDESVTHRVLTIMLAEEY